MSDVGTGPSGTGFGAIDDRARMISNQYVMFDNGGRVEGAGSPHRTSSFFPSPEPHAMDLPPLEGDRHDRLRENIRLLVMPGSDVTLIGGRVRPLSLRL